MSVYDTLNTRKWTVKDKFKRSRFEDPRDHKTYARDVRVQNGWGKFCVWSCADQLYLGIYIQYARTVTLITLFLSTIVYPTSNL